MKKDRTKSVLIRLTEEEKNKLQEMAEEEEMKVEPFVRKAIFSNDIKKLSNKNDALQEEIKVLKQEKELQQKDLTKLSHQSNEKQLELLKVHLINCDIQERHLLNKQE